MEEQKYILKDAKSFKLKDIFECGQCFRWQEEKDGSYTGIWENNVINVSESGNDIVFKGICSNGKIEDEIRRYFDLERDYEMIKKQLSSIDKNMELSIKYGTGIRILNQD